MIVLSFCTHIFRVYILSGHILGECNISCCRLVACPKIDFMRMREWKKCNAENELHHNNNNMGGTNGKYQLRD